MRTRSRAAFPLPRRSWDCRATSHCYPPWQRGVTDIRDKHAHETVQLSVGILCWRELARLGDLIAAAAARSWWLLGLGSGTELSRIFLLSTRIFPDFTDFFLLSADYARERKFVYRSQLESARIRLDYTLFDNWNVATRLKMRKRLNIFSQCLMWGIFLGGKCVRGKKRDIFFWSDNFCAKYPVC